MRRPTVFQQPSALIPLLMSMAALAIVLGHVAIYGAARAPDEGAAAHSWQLLMAAQIPLLLYFAFVWLPKAPKQAAWVLALQLLAFSAAAAPVLLLHL